MEDRLFQELKDWLVMFVRHRDLFKKSILNIKEEGRFVILETKNGVQYYAVLPKIEDIGWLLSDYQSKTISLVVYNTMDNLNAVLKYWDELARLPMLAIYFVNPNSSTDKKWIIYPFTHSKISEEASLKQGLLTLFEGVEPFSG